MNKNPFLNNSNDDEGSFLEQFEVRHSMRKDSIDYPDVDSEWKKLRGRLDVDNDENEATVRPSFFAVLRRNNIFRALASIAAIVVIIVAIKILFESSSSEPHKTVYAAIESDVTEITLKTSAGIPMKISGNLNFTPAAISHVNHIVEPDDTVIIETPPGKDLIVTLPDSTRVLLLANSRLEFAENFKKDVRNVRLTGEAFFDVTTDSLCPFFVETEYLNARVYGTEFRVIATGKKDSSVILINGKLAVTTPEDAVEKWLTPGEGAFITSADGIKIEQVDLYPYLQWRDGLFYFEDAKLFNILVKIGQWYNVNIVAQNDSLLSQNFHFVADRAMPVDSIVLEIADLTNSKVKFNDGQITIK